MNMMLLLIHFFDASITQLNMPTHPPPPTNQATETTDLGEHLVARVLQQQSADNAVVQAEGCVHDLVAGLPQLG